MEEINKVEEISKLYKELLGRNPDEPGLQHYLNSGFSLEEIRVNIMASYEYMLKSRKKDFIGTISEVLTDEKLLVGATPSGEEHTNSLIKSGVGAILNLDDSPFVEYDSSWCKEYLHVPTSRSTGFSAESAKQCLDFLNSCIQQYGYKTLIHSKEGLHRAPAVAIMYMVAVKGLRYEEALRLVLYRQPLSNPPRQLLTSSVLKYLKQYKKDSEDGVFIDTKVSSIEGYLYVGDCLGMNECFGLRKEGVDVILDVNSEAEDKVKEASWFTVQHISMDYSGKIDKFHKQIDTVVRNVKRWSGEGKKIYMYSEEGINSSIASICYLVDSGMELEKAIATVRQHVPTFLAANFVKSWMANKN